MTSSQEDKRKKCIEESVKKLEKDQRKRFQARTDSVLEVFTRPDPYDPRKPTTVFSDEIYKDRDK